MKIKAVVPYVNAPFPILARAALGFFKILENPLMMSLILSYIALLWWGITTLMDCSTA